MDFLQDIVTTNKDHVEKCAEGWEIIKLECDSYFKEIDIFLRTENADFFKPIIAGKENAEPAVVTNKRKGRLRKPALADVTENNILQTETFNIKKEKISIIQVELQDPILNVQIKKEVEEMPAPTRLPPRKKKIKTEKTDLPNRSTRSRAKKNEGNDEMTSDSESSRNTQSSDVIIQNTTITTIEISDNEKENDSETEKTNNQMATRSTRSKMRTQNKPEKSVKDPENTESDKEEVGSTVRNTRTKTRQKKRDRSNSTDHQSDQADKKRSKSDSNSEKESNATIQTEYEDAVSVIEPNQDNHQPAADTTYIASSKKTLQNENSVPSSINSTIVVENPKMVTKETKQIESAKSTRKDSEEIPKTPPKIPKKNANKQIFSPFEKTPVKKKVEAFERLGVESTGIPTRITRTKKKMQKNDEEQKEDGELKPNEKSKHSTEKEKLHTPIASKFIPKMCSTSKINKLHPAYSSNTSTSNESLLSVKSASALKASQAEFREREKRRQEKEREALRKREALLQAQTEEKRRKREEKQHRAQQQREILEKETQKQLEAQRIKEEKYKQAMAEREKKLQKQKEEADRKRHMAKKKANELLKEKEEAIRLAEQKKCAEMKVELDKQGEMMKKALKQKMERAQQPMPVYMMTKPPLLPTADCYDSDDPEYGTRKRTDPAWSRDRELKEMQLAMITVGETIKNSFFCRQAQTPDLQEIFEIIDPRKLKRTSSAIWRKPPRYTLMPTLEDTMEFSEDSD